MVIVPADALRSIPFSLRAVPNDEGSRLGGRSPEGIHPPRRNAGTAYLATVVLSNDPHVEASIFLTEREENDLLINGGTLYQGVDMGPIVVVTHTKSRRGGADAFRSELSERAIVLGAEQEDWYIGSEGERTVLGRHKIGGRPAIFKEWHLEEPIADLIRQGYVQVLQLDVPGPEDDVLAGSWPFGDGMFHLLGRMPFGEDDWVCFWEN